MDFWLLIIAVALTIASVPYVKSLILRMLLFLKLFVICKKYRMKLYGTHLFWILAGRDGKNCDFYVETNNELYSVKLFGVPRKLSVLFFTENGRYYIRYFLALISYTTSWVHYPIDGRRKELRNFDFENSRRASSAGKNAKNILLINPACREIRYIPDHGSESIIGCGDVIRNFEVESLSHFIERLSRLGKQNI